MNGTFRKMWVQVAFTRQNYPGLYSYKMRGRRKKKQKLGKEK
jgi:hypothetical protein